MLLKQETLKGIAEGRVTLQFRRWKRPTVKSGGTLLTSVGQLAIEAVEPVDEADLTGRDARAAGFGTLADLRKALGGTRGGQIYRIRLSLRGPDPRNALRERKPDRAELEEILGRLRRMDERSAVGSWTERTLEAIERRPGVRAADLAGGLGFETARFKTSVRKLRSLGLTESLEIGYRLSPRGRAVLAGAKRGSS